MEMETPTDLEQVERAKKALAAATDLLKAERVQETLAAEPTDRLKAERVQLMLQETAGWRLSADGRAILRRFRFPALRAAMGFTLMTTELAQTLLHQPGLAIHGNDVIVTFSTPSAGGLTLLDFSVARAVSLQPSQI